MRTRWQRIVTVEDLLTTGPHPEAETGNHVHIEGLPACDGIVLAS